MCSRFDDSHTPPDSELGWTRAGAFSSYSYAGPGEAGIADDLERGDQSS